MIIKHMNCVHDLHLKPYLTVSIQDTASQLLMNSQYIIVYNKVTVKITDYQDHS